MNRITYVLAIFWTVLSVVFSANSTASIGWLPNIVHYINNSSPLAPPLPEIPLSNDNFQDSSVIDWSNFGGDGFIYNLEFKLVGSDEWVQLYQGENSYFTSPQTLASGQYSFRVSCAGFTGCPAEGYISNTVDVVQKPAYVNAEYDHATNNVLVYWSDLAGVAGYTVEQTADNGVSWQAMNPAPETAANYEGTNYAGQVHTQNRVVLSNEAVAQKIQVAKKLQRTRLVNTTSAKNSVVNIASSSSSNDYEVGATLQYRVKTCGIVRCGDDEHSQILTIQNLNNVIPDPSFESGNIQFTTETGDLVAIDASNPIVGSKSLDVTLKNYGLAHYIHYYNANAYPILNGVTLAGKLRINSMSKDSKLSVYPVAYYAGHDRRIEGQKQEFTIADLGKDLTIKSALWLNNENIADNQVKRIYFLVRLIGEGTANFVLDDTQLFEGSGLAQTDPTLTAYYSNYSGIIKVNWSQFYNTNAKYLLEYKEDRADEWQQFYHGPNTTFTNEIAIENSGLYHFRIACQGVGNCPDDGYVRASTVLARKPAYVSVKTSATDTYLDWEDTVSAYGYLIEKSTDSGATWVPLVPKDSDASRSYTANDGIYRTVFSEPSLILSGVASSTDIYRVKACRWAGCKGYFKESNGVYAFDSIPEPVRAFNVDKTVITPGESIHLYWERPSNYSSDFVYNLYVTKSSGDGYPEVPQFLWESNLKIHSISRGGAAGIQRVGTQTIEIRACNTFGCSALESIEITVDGPPPLVNAFTVDSINIMADENVTFNWSMHNNYKQPVVFDLAVEKPDGTAKFIFNKSYDGNSFTREINMPGQHIFYIYACKISGECNEEGNSLTVNVGGVYQYNDKLYVFLPLEDGVKYLEFVKGENDEWVVTSLSKEDWNKIKPEEIATFGDYSLVLGDFTQDNIEDFKLINGDSELLVTQNENGVYEAAQPPRRNIIFIHTDILGSPVAETNDIGEIQ